MARKYLEEVMPEVGDRTDVIQLYGDVMLRVGEAEAAKEQLLPTVDRLLRAGDVARAAALIKRLLRTTPTDIEVLERARRVFDKLGDPDMVASIEVALAESYMRVRKVDEATKLYQRLVKLGPSEPDFRGRLEGLRKALRLPEGGAPPVDAAPQAAPEPARGAASRPETRSEPPAVAAEQPTSDVDFIDVDFDDDMGEAPAPAPAPAPRASMAPPDGGISPRPGVRASGETPPPMKLVEPASTSAPAPASASEELYTEAVVFAKYGLADKAISHIKRLLAVSPHHEKGLELLRSLGGTFEEPKTGPQPPAASEPPAAAQPLPKVEASAAEPEPELPLVADEDDLLFSADVGGPPVQEAPLGEVDMGFWSAGGQSGPEAASEPTATAELVTPEPGGFEGFDFSDVVVEIPAVPAEAPAQAQAPRTDSPDEPLIDVVEPAPAPDFSLGAAVPPVLEAPSPRRGSPLSLADLGEVVAAPAPVRSSRPSRGIAELEAMLGLGGGGEPGPPRPPSGQSTPARQAGRKLELDLGMLGLSERPAAAVGAFQSSAPDFSALDQMARPATVRSGAAVLPSAQAGQERLLDVAPGATEEPAPVVRPLERVSGGVVLSLPVAPASEPLGQAAGVDDVVPSLEATVPPAPELAEVELAEVELAEPIEEAMDLVEVGELLEGPSPDQLGELDFFIREGLLDEAAVMLAKLRELFGDHSELRTRQALLKARGWDEEKPVVSAEAAASELFSEEEGFFDLAKELEKELAEDELVAEATGAGKGQEASIEDLFKEFQRGVAEQIGDTDFDTHFNLGLAYREMGLLDEAIGEFQLSLRSTELFIESASNIGACYLEKGLPEQAAEWYARGLTSDRLSPEEAIGLRYHLGLAQEMAGRADEALGSFTEVLTVNPGFRDVVARVSRLRSN
jgi:pilus assembly protein FimV